MTKKPFDLGERTFQFADAVLDWVEQCPRTLITVDLLRQLIRSATSIGANTEEANEGQSPKDEASKLGIALKEVRETRYWFRLLKKRVPLTLSTDNLMQETVELANILKSRIRHLQDGNGGMVKGKEQKEKSKNSPVATAR